MPSEVLITCLSAEIVAFSSFLKQSRWLAAPCLPICEKVFVNLSKSNEIAVGLF